MSDGLWYLDEPESPEDIAAQLQATRDSMTPEQRRELAAFLVGDDDQQSAADPSAAGAERWQRQQAAMRDAAPEPSSHAPRGPAAKPAGSDLDEKIAAEREAIRREPGRPWDEYMRLKYEQAAG